MANADSLRVWLSVTLKVSLDADELSDLYAFTNMVNICPLDEEFGEVLVKFVRIRLRWTGKYRISGGRYCSG